MANRAKARGTSHETAVVNWMKAHGWRYARRITMKGTKDEGDIHLGDGIPVTIEAKNAKSFDISGWTDEMLTEVENAMHETGVVIFKKRGTTDVGRYYALTTVEMWNALALSVYKEQRPRRRIRRKAP